MTNFNDTVVIELRNGVPMYINKEVILSPLVHSLLMGKGEGAKIQIFKRDLNYK